MIYKMPPDTKYTDLCIYIDTHVYQPNHDADRIFQYIYLIATMLAQKHNLFERPQYYDEFGLFVARKVYLRLINKKQFEYNSDGTPKLGRVKSILNYLKQSLYYMKVDFEQEEYAQSLTSDAKDVYDYNYDNVISMALDGIHLSEFDMVMHNITQTCRSFLSTIPYPKSSVTWLNIYTSVMLTLLQHFTLPKKLMAKVGREMQRDRLTNIVIERWFHAEKYEEPVLFHIDASLRDYIIVLTRQVKRLIARDLSEVLCTKVSDDALSMAAMISEQAEVGIGYYENTD